MPKSITSLLLSMLSPVNILTLMDNTMIHWHFTTVILKFLGITGPSENMKKMMKLLIKLHAYTCAHETVHKKFLGIISQASQMPQRATVDTYMVHGLQTRVPALRNKHIIFIFLEITKYHKHTLRVITPGEKNSIVRWLGKFLKLLFILYVSILCIF